MARILDTDTEAFRSPEQKVVQRVPGETAREKWQTLGTMTEAIKGAVPLADLAVRGGSTLYGGIKDWFAEQEQKEEAEKAKARGAKKFEDDFAATKQEAGPTVTAAVAASEQAAKPEEAPSFNQMEIARQRLEQMKAHELGIPQREPKLSLEHREAEAPKAPVEPSALDRLNLQRQRGQKPGELSLQTKPEDWFTEQRPQEESRVVGTYLPGRKEEATEYTRVPYAEPGKETKTPGFEPMWASSQSLRPEREQELGALLGKKPPMSIRQMKTPQPESPEMGEPGDWFQPELKLKGMPAASALTPAQRAAALQATMPEPTASGATTEGEQEPGKTAAYRTIDTQDPFKTGRLAVKNAQPRKLSIQDMYKIQADQAADVKPVGEQAAPEAAKPMLPKTIGDATNDQLKMLKTRLESVAGRDLTDAQRQDLTARLKDVTDELEYRQTKDIPRTYEQWAAYARTADTPAKQARALELAKNVHMPVAGLADLLTPSAQLAERQALGSKEERGLFPAMAKQESILNIAKAAKETAIANRYNMAAPAERALLNAKIEKMLAEAGLSDVRAEQVLAYIEPDVAAKWELSHSRHEQADYYSAKAQTEEKRAQLRAAGFGVKGKGINDINAFTALINAGDKLRSDAETTEKSIAAMYNTQLDKVRSIEAQLASKRGLAGETEKPITGIMSPTEKKQVQDRNDAIKQAKQDLQELERAQIEAKRLKGEHENAVARTRDADALATAYLTRANVFADRMLTGVGYPGVAAGLPGGLPEVPEGAAPAPGVRVPPVRRRAPPVKSESPPAQPQAEPLKTPPATASAKAKALKIGQKVDGLGTVRGWWSDGTPAIEQSK